jgi:diguanylate cyclase (GGDEF)-like protein
MQKNNNHNKRLYKILDRLPSTIALIAHKKGEIQFCNRYLLRQIHQIESYVGMTIFDFFHLEELNSDDESLFADCRTLQAALKPDGRLFNLEIIDCDADYIILGELAEVNESDLINKMATNTNEISNLSRQLRRKNRELEIANSKISRLMRVDPLTGLYNRRTFSEIYEQNFNGAKRYNHVFSIIMCDIDKFKSINDIYGHDVGDKVLVAFSLIFINDLRTEDTAFRFGGEEFLIILPQTVKSDALLVAEKLRKKFEESEIIEKRPVTASFGVTSWMKEDTKEVILKRVDLALYEAKNNGRNRVIFK